MAKMAKPWKHPQNGIYYLRVEVPVDIRDKIGKREIKSSLRTRDFNEAKRLFSFQYAEVQALFHAARTSHVLLPKEIDALAETWLDEKIIELDTLQDFEKYLIFTKEYVNGEERQVVEPYIEEFKDALLTGDRKFQEKLIGKEVRGFIDRSNLFIAPESAQYLRLLDQVTRASIKLSETAYKRYEGDWLSKPRPRVGINSNVVKRRLDLQGDELRSDSSLVQLIDRYVNHKLNQGDWDEKTKGEAESIFKVLVEQVGKNRDPDSISREEIRNVSETLLALPSNYTKNKRLSGLTLSS